MQLGKVECLNMGKEGGEGVGKEGVNRGMGREGVDRGVGSEEKVEKFGLVDATSKLYAGERQQRKEF